MSGRNWIGQSRRRWTFFALLAALSLVAFACGDGGEADDGGGRSGGRSGTGCGRSGAR